jgi:hypothetical protein
MRSQQQNAQPAPNRLLPLNDAPVLQPRAPLPPTPPPAATPAEATPAEAAPAPHAAPVR